MRDSRPRIRLLASLVAIVVLSLSTGAAAQFVCDVDPWSQTANSGFGAGPGEIRGFAVTPPGVPDECLVDGVSFLNGVILNVTQQGGSSTMPIELVEIRESSQGGPPGAQVITFGSGDGIMNVPPFPSFERGRLPTEPNTWVWDQDDDGQIDAYAAPVAFIDGDSTPGQFLAYSTNGATVPCHTGLQGGPIDEPCANGDPNFRSMGLGVETAGGFAEVFGAAPGPVDFSTNNPDATGDGTFRYVWRRGEDFTSPNFLDFIRIFDSAGQLLCQDGTTGPGTERSCVLAPEKVQEFLDGVLEVELQDSNDIGRRRIIPANRLIFLDGFESGDTSSWSNTVP